MDCSASFVIGQSNYFGFGFATLNIIENCPITDIHNYLAVL